MSRSLSAPRVLPAAFFALAALSAPPSHAAPPDPARKAQCAAAFEEGQELEKAGRLVEARGKFVSCSDQACPAVVRDECATMLPRVESSLPTIVPGLRDAQGNDVVSAEVTLDGTVLTKTLDGQPIAVNPGPHTLRFVAPNAAPVERQVVVRVGEKNRVITVDLEAKGAAEQASPDGGPDKPAASGTSGKRVASYVLGGLGVVSLGAFAYLGITGKADLAGLRDGCGRTQSCAEADVDAVKTKLLLADVSLGVGVVSLGVATALFFTSGGDEKKPAAAARAAVIPVVAPLPGGGAAMLVGTF
ncbi:hypothetical protein [Polyangium mundeleinium]|uniref:PEGA domain-containing protein n=1 Tax=Polyangium mundeleinium TaxID=2995306 RepID=A0ABT5EM77_9BACT|nr:hypothetical protein [Polyangium mundeleinium]MDC0742866.1 hypothetical protein [Polyangium mundeleinium]